jgi:DNA-binding IclR family transcriptional regulator
MGRLLYAKFTSATSVHISAFEISMSTAINSVKSADRALELLELFAIHLDGLTLTDVSERTGWPKSSSLALLRTLHQRQYLESTGTDGKYHLGPRVAALGSAYLNNLSLAREGAEVVREVARSCDETVHLAVLRGSDVLYIAKEEGGGQMRMVSTVGRMIPAHATGVGKMLLASLPIEELDLLYPPGVQLKAMTEKTVTDRIQFAEILEGVREQGFARDEGESTLGVKCIAAPVLDVNGSVIAAMSVSVPEPRFTNDRVPRLHRILMDGARKLSLRMGCPENRLPAAMVREVTHVAG